MVLMDDAKAKSCRPSISAVLPAYNEAPHLAEVVAGLTAALAAAADRFEVIVVDDGSADNTGALADELARRDPRVRVVHHSGNQGYGAALRSGFAAAREDWLFFMDADGQFEPREITNLVAWCPDRDLIVGYRADRRDPFARKLYGKIFSALVRALFRVRVRDVNCAFKLFKKNLLEGVVLRTRGALINAELLIAARQKHVSPLEVPVTHLPRRGGLATGGSPRVILRAAREILDLYRSDRKRKT